MKILLLVYLFSIGTTVEIHPMIDARDCAVYAHSRLEPVKGNGLISGVVMCVDTDTRQVTYFEAHH